MTATPIPRTLAMTLYGDMNISVVAERPQGRGNVRTLWFGSERRQAVYSWCGGVLAEGAQAYIVCPWVDSEGTWGTPAEGGSLSDRQAGASGGKNAVRVFEDVKKKFPERSVELLHGKMKSEEKKVAMRRFREGEADILVSTSLIEVGVDVPKARFMVIENAEKFGLAQLHQLRGRIGRGSGDSFCVVLSDSELPETVERLEAFVETESGFEIAEKDLLQRGAGELHGQRQHGIIPFRIGDMTRDGEWMAKAKRAAGALIEKDPQLQMPDHAVIRRVLAERFTL
jgi:ATP-dependent DNA helicase RecG